MKHVKRESVIEVVAAVFLIFLAFKYGGNIYNTVMLYATNMTKKNVVVKQASEKVIPTVNPVISSTVNINFKVISKELLNNWRWNKCFC